MDNICQFFHNKLKIGTKKNAVEYVGEKYVDDFVFVEKADDKSNTGASSLKAEEKPPSYEVSRFIH